MIYIGYQGVGKSSISGKNNCIDLESGNFWVDGVRIDEWYKIYCNIAQHLSNQGYKVFMSSHKAVRDELNKRNIYFAVICPDIKLKDEWVNRLQERYDRTQLEKDYKALMNAKEMYSSNIDDLMQEKNVIVIENINYDLLDILKDNELEEGNSNE
jgi:hypothetical protein